MTQRTVCQSLVSVFCLSFAVEVVIADTLVMRDGRRVQGDLVGFRDNTIDFDTRTGRLRVDRRDVVRIEFDDYVPPSSGSGFAPGSGSASGSPSRPSGLRERDVSVDARAGWFDTGITVRAGQTIYFNATGRVRWGPGRQDGPAGENKSPRNDNRPIPSRPAAALIGRINDSAEYFFIGDETGPIRVREGGRLFLGLNDDFLQDNSGAFRVTIYY